MNVLHTSLVTHLSTNITSKNGNCKWHFIVYKRWIIYAPMYERLCRIESIHNVSFWKLDQLFLTTIYAIGWWHDHCNVCYLQVWFIPNMSLSKQILNLSWFPFRFGCQIQTCKFERVDNFIKQILRGCKLSSSI